MKKKFKFSIKDISKIFNKKENLAIMAVALVFCAGLIVTNMKSGDIPLHDGDVLVDSQNVQTAGDTDNSGNDTVENAESGDRTDPAAILKPSGQTWNLSGTN